MTHFHFHGVWCCPIKVKAAIKNSATRSALALALALFGIFYPKEELKGRRLQDLDRDIIEAITGEESPNFQMDHDEPMLANTSQCAVAEPNDVGVGSNLDEVLDNTLHHYFGYPNSGLSKRISLNPL
ncbi:hypothetical protein OS493_000898 [Desmophyllum pertusum]|uniref:Uncharacterized protein n=1 Tax=Desmophyllum pertusum TaxID=174260 RepID=A0A9W9ZU80_9CNID|nr:hypothetical protein OS493_000898 [Desmophyllum pertusum]